MTPADRRCAAALVAGVLAAHLLALQALSPWPGGPRATAGPAREPVFLVPPAAPSIDAPAIPAPARDQSAHTPAAAPSRGAWPAEPSDAKLRGGAPAAGEPGDAAGAAARVAPSRHLTYSLSGQTRGLPWTGRADLHWQHDGQRYDARLDLEGPGPGRRSQRSTGSITDAGLAPERFSERTRAEAAVHFRRDTGHITFSAHRPATALLAGAQDRLSVLLQLGALIAARPQAYPVGSILSVQTATARDAEVWRFRIQDTEELPLSGGHQSTLRLVRAPSHEFDPRIDLWLAPALDYAPVRLRLTQAPGDWLEYQWVGSDRR